MRKRSIDIKNDKNIKNKEIMRNIIVAVILIIMLAICIITISVSFKVNKSNKNNEIAIEIQVDNRKIMDKLSLDWSIEDEKYLLKIAELYADKYDCKTPLNYARFVIVTLNRVYDTNYQSTIRSVCVYAAHELGVTEKELINTKISNNSKYALDIIKLDRFDDTKGSCMYDKVLKYD